MGEDNVFDLLTKLGKFKKQEIEFALSTLMLSGKIDFISVSNAYVNSLKSINEDKENRLIEAESCVLESFLYKRGNNEKNNQSTQRGLYLLNKSNRYQMGQLNEKYHYDEKLGKESSWYERNKLKETYI